MWSIEHPTIQDARGELMASVCYEIRLPHLRASCNTEVPSDSEVKLAIPRFVLEDRAGLQTNPQGRLKYSSLIGILAAEDPFL